MKRQSITLAELADRDNLLLAAWKTLRGSTADPQARAWRQGIDENINDLAQAILRETVPSGALHRFVIHDPKRREIAAPALADRVLHHALFNLAEPRFERLLVPSTFACRPGLGVHAAVAHLQRCLQRAPCWLQVDVKSYFSSIDHAVLLRLLARWFKGAALLRLLQRIVQAGSSTPGTGLPIGALTSQHFANAYLDNADRWLLAHPLVRGHVRYMDDIVCTCNSLADARQLETELRARLQLTRSLELKAPARCGYTRFGLRFCGFRVKPGVVLAGQRKLRRYREGAARLHMAEMSGDLAPTQAQRAADVLHATLAHTCSRQRRRAVWRRLGAYSGNP